MSRITCIRPPGTHVPRDYALIAMLEGEQQRIKAARVMHFAEWIWLVNCILAALLLALELAEIGWRP